MNATALQLDGIMQFLMTFSTRNKKWLADRLYEAVKTEKAAKAAKAAENEITPKLMAKIEKARADFKAGNIAFRGTAAEAKAWIESL